MQEILRCKLQSLVARQGVIIEQAKQDGRDLSDDEFRLVESLQDQFDALEPTLAAAIARDRLR